MSVLISLTSRTGDVAGPTVLVDVVPRVGEFVEYLIPRGLHATAEVIKVKHSVWREQSSQMHGRGDSQARVYVFLDVPDSFIA